MNKKNNNARVARKPHLAKPQVSSDKPLIESPTIQKKMQWLQKIIVSTVFLSVFLLYLVTLMSSIPSGDSSELIASAYILGISHPPGYPLFHLLGKLFSLFPVGNIVWRINLSAAVFNLLAAFFIYLTLCKLIKNWSSALLGAVFFAVSPIVWEYSIKAEVFSLNNLFAALIIYLLVAMREYYLLCELKKLNEDAYRDKSRKIFYLILFICGLALTNHHTIILLFPSVGIFLFYYSRYHLLTSRTVFISFCCFCIGLSVYLYIPIRASAEPYLNWDAPNTWDGFITLVTRADYGTFKLMSGNDKTYSLIEKYSIYLFSLLKQFNPVGVLLALSGIFFLIRNKAKILSVSLLLSFILPSFVFFMLANVPKTKPLYLGVFERFYMLPAVLVAIFIGLGVYSLQQWLTDYFKKQSRGSWYYLINGLVASSIIVSVIINFPRLNLRDVTIVSNYGRDILNSVEKNALILSWGDTNSNTLDNLQLVDGLRPDLVVLDQEKLTYFWYCQQMRMRHPTVTIPFERYDGQKGKIIQLVEANMNKRPIYVLGGLKEDSLFQRYRLMPMGLVRKVVNKDYWPAHEPYIKENEQLWSQYHLLELKRPYLNTSFEYQIVNYYALAHFFLGLEYQQVSLVDLAIKEYNSSISVDPLLAESYKNLGLIYANMTYQLDKAISTWKIYIGLNPIDKDKEAIVSFIKSNEHHS